MEIRKNEPTMIFDAALYMNIFDKLDKLYIANTVD